MISHGVTVIVRYALILMWNSWVEGILWRLPDLVRNQCSTISTWSHLQPERRKDPLSIQAWLLNLLLIYEEGIQVGIPCCWMSLFKCIEKQLCTEASRPPEAIRLLWSECRHSLGQIHTPAAWTMPHLPWSWYDNMIAQEMWAWSHERIWRYLSPKPRSWTSKHELLVRACTSITPVPFFVSDDVASSMIDIAQHVQVISSMPWSNMYSLGVESVRWLQWVATG